MALIAETGDGLANANSFVSVADADTYLADRGRTAWVALTTQQREYALIAATDYINSAFSFVGNRRTTTQALAWPRVSPGDWRTPAGVPVQVKQAVTRVADLAATEGLSLFGAVNGTDLVKRVQAGSVSVEFSDMGLSVSATGRAMMPWLSDLMAGLIVSGPDNVADANGFAMLPVVRT